MKWRVSFVAVLSLAGLAAESAAQIKVSLTPPPEVPPPVARTQPATVAVELETREVRGVLANDRASLHSHSIDLHAVTGPGGGAVVSQVAPGEEKVFEWKALNPGLFAYHCAGPPERGLDAGLQTHHLPR